MAGKRVNLLEGDDDDESRGDGSMANLRDGEGGFRERGGGWIDVLMIVLFVFVMLGGVAWAGYQFWWIPKHKKEAEIERAREREKNREQGSARLAKMGVGDGLKRQKPAGAPPSHRNAHRNAQERGEAGGAANPAMRPARPHHEGLPPGENAPGAGAPARKPAKPVEPAEKIPLLSPPRTFQPPSAVAATKKPAAPPPEAKKRDRDESAGDERKAEAAKKSAPKKKVGMEQAAPRPPVVPAKRVVGTGEQKAKGQKVSGAGGAGARATPPRRGSYYSVQVASCRTGRCVSAYSKRLKEKGFSSFQAARLVRGARGRTTEVRLGAFASRREAQALAKEARSRKIIARVYRHQSLWRVSAGSFRDLEDAAILLDRVEDAGFRGVLASRPRSGSTRLYAVRTGRFQKFGEASAFRKKILAAGFEGAYVVRQRPAKK